jgi:hypothetical protein
LLLETWSYVHNEFEAQHIPEGDRLGSHCACIDSKASVFTLLSTLSDGSNLRYFASSLE